MVSRRGFLANPANWPMLVIKMGDLLRKDYDWSTDIAAIKEQKDGCRLRKASFVVSMERGNRTRFEGRQ